MGLEEETTDVLHSTKNPTLANLQKVKILKNILWDVRNEREEIETQM